MSSGKRIVVLGGGAAGSQIAKSLSQQLTDASTVTLIEAREYYAHYIGSLRTVVTEEGSLEDKVLIPLDKLFTKDNGRVVHEAVASVSSNASGDGGVVTTNTGASYPYDILVIATGNTWEGPLAFPPGRLETVAHINEWRKRFRNANGIAIVGGGPVGSELAGELRDLYKDKAITIVQRESRLLSSVYPEKYRRYVDQRWTERGITIIADDEVERIPAFPAANVTTKKGVGLNADLVVPCRGGRPNTAFLASLGKNILTSRGHVRVNQHLQVEGLPGVFAAGDIIDWDEVKQAVKYTGHTTTIVANIKRVVSGAQPTAVYKSSSEVILLTNGVNGGAAYLGILWGIVLGDWFVRMAKSKDLFITMTRKTLGY
ncbi:FAD/NAD(P)-binding domain-containing protein [Panaeolus papilionaceus]|nr:FAD/NAD(P)-binding domain-containing protein [Panaeolus papilionaceus]